MNPFQAAMTTVDDGRQPPAVAARPPARHARLDPAAIEA
jgi:hypothetical protein